MPDLWTDRELDLALADQPATAFSADARARALARLDAALAEPAAPARRRRGLVAAAAVAALAGGLLTALSVGGDAPTADASGPLTEAAAGVLSTADTPLAAGRFQYVSRRAWDLAMATTSTGKPLSVLVLSSEETWVPRERADEWVRRSTTRDWTWMVGSEALARAEGDSGLLGTLRRGSTERRGPCGDFPGDNGELGGTPDDGKPCAQRRGSWHHPAPPFLAALPRDPAALHADLWAAAGGNPVTALDLAAGVLASPDAPRPLRAALYRALAALPGLEVTENSANLDGQTGTALGVADAQTGNTLRYDIIVDTRTGRLIGDRTVLLDPAADSYYTGLAPGTPIAFSTVTVATAAHAP